MKINKLFGVKSITNLIYGILLFIPFASILSRVIYVQANPFAKDSYSDNYVDKVSLVNSTALLLEGSNYLVNYSTNISASTSVVMNISNTNLYDYIDTNNRTISSISFVNENYPRINLYFTDSTNLRVDNWNNYTTSFTIILSYTNWNPANTNLDFANIYLVTYQINKLDNVFEYSIKSFTDDNNLGNVDFFSWFTNMFLNQNNPTNAVYLGFTNWYLNYALLVSSGYLLFFALMWFINYVRKMLEKASYHDFGGF